MKIFYYLFITLVVCINCQGQTSCYSKWSNGPGTDPGYFPIGVWLQGPEDAAAYRQAGINYYIGLWKGPTAGQLNTLKSADMQVICHQNQTALEFSDDKLADGRPLIIGYMHSDEPDNAQPQSGGGYGPPISYKKIQQLYDLIKQKDATRPVILNIGQGIAWDSKTWIGQGGHISPDRDYPGYINGSDIISYDIYPMDSGRKQIAGQAWRVALGLQRLAEYAPEGHIRWNAIETGDINGNGNRATIEEIKAEVWMSILSGSKGIFYFIHGKTSVAKFDHKALLRAENTDTLAGIKAINRQVLRLAPLVNSKPAAGVVSASGDVPVITRAVYHEGSLYIFAVSMRNKTGKVNFKFNGAAISKALLYVDGENRNLHVESGNFSDSFEGYQVHIYKIDIK